MHKEAQFHANRGYRALREDRPEEALESFEEAWGIVERHSSPWSTPISGFIQTGLAEASFAGGDFAGAARRMEKALSPRAWSGSRAEALCFLGKARRRADDKAGAAEAFLQMYVYDGRTLLNDDPEDRAVLDAKLEELRALRRHAIEATMGLTEVEGAPLEALAVVANFSRALDAINTFAFETHKEARTRSDEEEEREHGRAVTRRWCELVATWCTPGKVDYLSHCSSDNPHSPERESAVRATHDAKGRLEVWTESTEEGGCPQTYLYALVEHADGWWVDDAFSVFDCGEPEEERYTMFE